MSKPAQDAESAALHMRRRDLNRPSRAATEAVEIRGGRPKMPTDLTPEQQALWKQMVRQLRQRRTVTPGDQHILELYVRTHSQWKAACEHVAKHGPMITEERYAPGSGTPYTVEVPNPAVKITATLAAQLESLLKEMGLTGISREKVKAVKTAEKLPAAPGSAQWYMQNAAAIETMPEIEIPNLEEENAEADDAGRYEVPPGDSGPVQTAD